MIRFPVSASDFRDRFPHETACRAYLEEIRWRKRPRCPRCPRAKVWRTKGSFFRCASCGYDFTVTVNTLFADTHLPLRLWLEGIWIVTTKRDGTSALALQRMLGLRSYQTAWRWLQKVRRIMANAERRLLTRAVEVGLVKLTGCTTDQGPVLILAQVHNWRIGRIRLVRLGARRPAAVTAAIRERVKAGARVLTDDWSGYAELKTMGYRHRIIGPPTGRDGLLPNVQRVAEELQGWLRAVPGGATAASHLDHYLHEFAFRFSRRQSGRRGRLFHQLVREALRAGPVWCEELIGSRLDGPARERPFRQAAR